MKIIETTISQIDEVMSLWADRNVMFFVGFPDGYIVEKDYMTKWINWAIQKPNRCHYSIYDGNTYCGETFYNVDEQGYAALDIKLFPFARGKGIAFKALSFAIEEAFNKGNAKVVYVDPNLENKNAWKLYRKLGFIQKETPNGVDADDTYQEISREQWEILRNID